jgi:hypothetical protein
MSLWLFLSLLAMTVLSQTSIEAFRDVLRTQATLTPADLTTLEQGQLVAKLLPVGNKREVAVVGVVRLEAPLELFLRSARGDVGQQNNEAILQIGKFSNSPTLDDLQGLTLEARDIEDLKQCTPGDCRVKMSAAMIQRFRNEVDWSAADYAAQATLLFKRMLVDYVRDYLARGNAALMEYNDRSTVVRVADEQQALIGSSIYFNDFAPEFLNYLKSPVPKLAGAEDSICWSKIKFGLKPVITLTHVVIYQRPKGAPPQALVASKQIYANHYFDSSLALTAFINTPNGAPGSTYLFYTNRSRADALGGALGGLKRVIVEKQALDGLKTILKGSKQSIEGKPSGPPGNELDLQSRSLRLLAWFGKHWLISLGMLVTLFVFLLWLNRRVARQRTS